MEHIRSGIRTITDGKHGIVIKINGQTIITTV